MRSIHQNLKVSLVLAEHCLVGAANITHDIMTAFVFFYKSRSNSLLSFSNLKCSSCSLSCEVFSRLINVRQHTPCYTTKTCHVSANVTHTGRDTHSSTSSSSWKSLLLQNNHPPPGPPPLPPSYLNPSSPLLTVLHPPAGRETNQPVEEHQHDQYQKQCQDHTAGEDSIVHAFHVGVDQIHIDGRRR